LALIFAVIVQYNLFQQQLQRGLIVPDVGLLSCSQ
jgi:hypothetical protein